MGNIKMNREAAAEREWQNASYPQNEFSGKLSGLPPRLAEYYLLLSWPLQFGLAPAVESR
ncbi:hypothetical protein SNR37_001605 [Agarivorans aestuarii]|uniref:Uncharacterized protein n=1 Tax=Agarivorans aestuarii TaxID=1563703 RepID=A0ABU7GA47_9ALTE|nr:hypothetical protein [Agarivorans aestuarii]MEE1676273.1 hypothetical protein [Agarivorans aestuarii]